MTAAMRQRGLYVLLGLAVIWGVYNVSSPRKPKAKSDSGSAAVAVAPQTTVPSPQVDIASYELKPWGNDPFRTQTGRQNVSPTVPNADRSAPSWKLSGIVYSEDDPLAIVNNRSVRVGDRINGATVVDINRREVTLDAGGSRVTLRVTPKG